MTKPKRLTYPERERAALLHLAMTVIVDPESTRDEIETARRRIEAPDVDLSGVPPHLLRDLRDVLRRMQAHTAGQKQG